MKIFVSSLISGMEELRAAAREAVLQLGHEPIMAEDFPAQPNSPQVACLQGLRQSSLVVLILGQRYGAIQPSGLSATHEEYQEGKERLPVLTFVQEGVAYEDAQNAFLGEVQAWQSGFFRGGFSSAAQLRQSITRSIHQWELANASGPVNEEQLRKQCLSLIAIDDADRHRGEPALIVAIAAGPAQSIIRPTELEQAKFRDELLQISLFGSHRLFTPASPTITEIDLGALVISHDKGQSIVRLDTKGHLLCRLSLPTAGHGMILIEEDVAETLIQALRFGAGVLDRVDPTHRLTHVAIAVAISGRGSSTWRTRKEQEASPNSWSGGYGDRGKTPVHLDPAVRPRAALTHQQNMLADDLITLLRRQTMGRG